MAELLPVDVALARLLEGEAALPAEEVGIADAAWRVLAADIVSRRTQPPFPASAMDGYAVRADDIANLPVTLRVIGESIAGLRFDGAVGAGETVRIFTGAPVPDGADTILLQEDAKVVGDGIVEALEATAKGRHIRRAGLDFARDELLLPAGRQLDPAALSLAAAGNYPRLPVVRKPLVAVLATGTELVAPGTTPGPDQIIASNGYGVSALARAMGAKVLDLGIVPDDMDLIRAAIRRAIEAGADILVTLGGASVGDHDLVHTALSSEGMTLDFWKIAMRPGKPLMYGRLGGTRVLGLPGNPVSSLVCSHLFLKPLLARLAGLPFDPDIRDAVLGSDMAANQQRRDYVRAYVAHAEHLEGQFVATPFPVQDSSMLMTLAAANALIIREPHAPEAKAGDACKVMLIR